MSSGPDTALNMFCAYSHKDERLLEELIEHLAPFRRLGRIDVWHDRRIDAGTEWEGAIDERIQTYPVILLLISSSFVNSDYCYGKELAVAIGRHNRGEARVIPIILRPCDWKATPIAKLQALPRDATPVTRWENRDEAWLDVVTGIRRAIEAQGGERPRGARASNAAEAPALETPVPGQSAAIVGEPTTVSAKPGRHPNVQENLRPRKACLVLENVMSKGSQESTTFIAYFRNEGEWPAFDVRVTHDVSTPPRERAAPIVCPRLDPVQVGERLRRQTGPARCAYSFTIPALERTPTGEVCEGQEHFIYLHLDFRDGLDDEDDAVYVLHLRPDGTLWKVEEDRARAVLSPFCRRVRPEAKPSPSPTRQIPVRFGAGADELRLSADAEEVLLAAARVALRTGQLLMTTDDIGAEPGIAPHDEAAFGASVDALLRRELLARVQDLGSLGLRVRLTPAGLAYALPIVVPNFDEQVERLRRAICDVKQITAEELTHTGISELVVEQVALDFARQGLLRTRRYAEGTMKIDSPLPELCR